MIKHNSAAMAVALSVFGLSLFPTVGNAIPAPALTIATPESSGVQLAAVVVKKKVVIKKHGHVTKKTVVVTKRRTAPTGVRVAVHPVVGVTVKRSHRQCKTVIRTVKTHGRMVRTTRRVC